MSARLRHSPARDQAWGRFYARRRSARILHEALAAPSPQERLARYYADLSRATDFHPVAPARAARGLQLASPTGVQPQRSSPHPAAVQANPPNLPASGQQAPITKPRKRAKESK